MVANEGLPPLKGTTQPLGAPEGTKRPSRGLRELSNPFGGTYE